MRNRQRQRIVVDLPKRPTQSIEDGLGDLYGLTPLLVPALLGWASSSWLVFSMVATGVVIFTLSATLKGVWILYRLIRWMTYHPPDIRWVV